MDMTNPFKGNESFLENLHEGAPTRLRWHLDCGSLEWLLGSNERLAAALGRAGADVTFVVRHAGHNWVNWRNGLAAGLRYPVLIKPRQGGGAWGIERMESEQALSRVLNSDAPAAMAATIPTSDVTMVPCRGRRSGSKTAQISAAPTAAPLAMANPSYRKR